MFTQAILIKFSGAPKKKKQTNKNDMNVGEGPGKEKWSGRVRKIRGNNGWCDRRFFTNRRASVAIYIEERQPVGLVVPHLWFMLLLGGITTLNTCVMSTRTVFTFLCTRGLYWPQVTLQSAGWADASILLRTLNCTLLATGVSQEYWVDRKQPQHRDETV